MIVKKRIEDPQDPFKDELAALGWKRRVNSQEWEQGVHHFNGTWKISKAAKKVLNKKEINLIRKSCIRLATVNNGIDFALFFDHKGKDLIILVEDNKKENSVLIMAWSDYAKRFKPYMDYLKANIKAQSKKK